MEQHQRHPLKDIGVNSPSLKRQKLPNPDQRIFNHDARQLQQAQAHTQSQTQTQVQTESQQQVHQPIQQAQAMPLPVWQTKWRKIMHESVIYFDSNDLSLGDSAKKKEKEKAIRLFTQVGATVQQFFDNSVTIVVSNRAKNELPKNISNHSSTLKFWNYEKVFRFLKHLGEKTSSEPQYTEPSNKLSALLQDEKIHGTNDRDPNAKRDDFNYFKYPYFYVYDLRQVVKPIALREWKYKEAQQGERKPWPHLHNSTYGHSLFQPDPANAHDKRKKERRRLRDEQNKVHRDRLRAIYAKQPNEIINLMDSEEENESEEVEELAEDEGDVMILGETTIDSGNSTLNLNMPPPPQQQVTKPPPTLSEIPKLSRQGSLIHYKFIEPIKRDNFEIEASGYIGSTNVSNQSAETKNGLVAPTSTVPSKQVNSLHRRLIEKRQKMSQEQVQPNNNKQKIPGYCENCRVHFDDFDEHCVNSRHKAFAEDDSNFVEIDELIMKLQSNIHTRR